MRSTNSHISIRLNAWAWLLVRLLVAFHRVDISSANRWLVPRSLCDFDYFLEKRKRPNGLIFELFIFRGGHESTLCSNGNAMKSAAKVSDCNIAVFTSSFRRHMKNECTLKCDALKTSEKIGIIRQSATSKWPKSVNANALTVTQTHTNVRAYRSS